MGGSGRSGVEGSGRRGVVGSGRRGVEGIGRRGVGSLLIGKTEIDCNRHEVQRMVRSDFNNLHGLQFKNTGRFLYFTV